MDFPGHMQSSVKLDGDENLDFKSDMDNDNEEREGYNKKHKSIKSKKFGNEEEVEGTDSSGRSVLERNESRKSLDRSESRKRSGSDEDDYDMRKEIREKHFRLRSEESSLEKLSNWYQDRDSDNKHDNTKRQKEGKVERLTGLKLGKVAEIDYKYLEGGETSQVRGHGSSESGRNFRRRWDEADATRKAEESSYVAKSDSINEKSSDPRQVGTNTISTKFEFDESKSKNLVASNDRGVNGFDGETINNIAPEGSIVENYVNFEENDCSTWMRDKNSRDVEHLNRSRTPERIRKSHYESEHFEMEHERSNTSRWKEVEKDGYRDDWSKRRDDSLSDKNRDWEGSKDMWKRRQGNMTDKERKDDDVVYDYSREWDFQRRGRERYDNERSQGRSGSRKDGSRTEAVKTSSKYGISNENYDVIEIQTKPFCSGKDESRSSFSRRSEVSQQSDIKSASDHEYVYPSEGRARKIDSFAPSQYGDDLKDGVSEDGSSIHDQNSWRDEIELKSQKESLSHFSVLGQSSSGASQLSHRNDESGSFGRSIQQGVKGNRVGRGGRGRHGGKDNQVAITVPMLGSPMVPLGMPPRGAMQPLTPSMSPAPGPVVSPSVFIPPFLPPPVLWPGARGFEMNALAIPPGLSPVPPGPSGTRFSPNIGTPPNPSMYFDQMGLGRGLPSNVSGPCGNSMVPVGRGQPQDKAPMGWATPRSNGATVGWVTPRNNGPLGKAPSRGEQNDYSQNFVDTGMRPQNFIRELELTSVVEDYPKLRELIQKKDEIVSNSASPPMYHKCDLHEQELSPDFFGTKFDVILVDPPWEEYVHRAPGVTDHMECWTFEEIMNLKIEAIADTPSFIFLWVGDGVGLEQGRQCLKKWGFRRCEDICWIKTNKTNATPGLRHDSHTLFQRSKEHCLMGIKGTVRRSIDGHIIHANIDTDVIIAEEPPYGSTAKPEDMYRIVEHFALGRRRLELFGEDHNIRSGWLTVGKGLSSSNFSAETYIRNFADKDGKVWQGGGGGRNPPPEAPHLVKTTPEIESLRPKSPMRSQQQQQSASISLIAASSSSRRPAGNSPQNHSAVGLNQEASSLNASSHWASQVESFKGGPEGSSNIESVERNFDIPPGYDVHFGQANDEHLDFESRTGMSMI